VQVIDIFDHKLRTPSRTTNNIFFVSGVLFFQKQGFNVQGSKSVKRPFVHDHRVGKRSPLLIKERDPRVTGGYLIQRIGAYGLVKKSIDVISRS
jgi:hypothetical protein